LIEYELDALVGGINAANTHEEVSFGAPVGKEAL
jgi:antitoxin MazE